MRFHYVTPLLIAIPLLCSAENVWGCLGIVGLPQEIDIQYPPADMVSFQGVIRKVSSLVNPNRGFPHSGFQLELKITRVYQGDKLGDIITINYGGCHELPEKAGSEINVLARFNKKKEGWYAPQSWKRSNKSIKKREWYQWW